MSDLLHNAKELRKNMTKEERKLWYDFLKGHPLHWYRQRIVGNYILDFYCSVAKLAIELDGSQHFSEEGIEYDKVRTDYLNSCGITVLRFQNLDVNNHFESVCMEIDEWIKTSQSANADSSPKRGANEKICG